MARLGRVLSAAVIVGAGAAFLPGSVLAETLGQQDSARQSHSPVTRIARLSAGTITGIVRDERGGPIAGARVTAIGATMALAFTDKAGRFETQTLPAGEYVVNPTSSAPGYKERKDPLDRAVKEQSRSHCEMF